MLRDLIKWSFSLKSIKLCGGICVGKQFRVMQKHVIQRDDKKNSFVQGSVERRVSVF